MEKFIKVYWTVYNPTDEAVEMPIVPDGFMDIIWLNGTVFLSGLIELALVVNIAPKDRFFGVQFQPYALAILWNTDVSKYNDKLVPIEEIDTYLGYDFKEIIEKDSKPHKALNRYFEMHFSGKSIDTYLLDALRLIHVSHGNILVSDCAATLKIHPKKLERLFVKYLGVSVKKFSKIIRFYDTHCTLKKEGLEDLTQKVLEKGYFDQAHFNRDYKKLTGHTPTSELMSILYNT